MPCPLCLLGFTEEEHTKENWKRVATPGDPLHDKLEEIRKPVREAQRKHFEETGELLIG